MRTEAFRTVARSASAVLCAAVLLCILVPGSADGELGQEYDLGRLAPRLRKSNFVSFYLYPNQDDWDEEHRIITDNEDTLEASGFNKSVPVTLLIHGLLSDHYTIPDMQQIKDAYLNVKYPRNIIMVDYGKLAVSKLPYLLSPLGIIRLGVTYGISDRTLTNEIVDFITFLMRTRYLGGPEDLHIVGFSHGALVNRRVAKRLFDYTGRRTGRVSVLEGAGETVSRARAPLVKYADFVDYTVTGQAGLALLDRNWDVQFFINGGGFKQPSCPNAQPGALSYCSHLAAVFYFARSIRKKNIMGCKCESSCLLPPKNCTETTIYGQYASEMARGRYYVDMR